MRPMDRRMVVPPVRYREYREAEAVQAEQAEARIVSDLEYEEMLRKGIAEIVADPDRDEKGVENA